MSTLQERLVVQGDFSLSLQGLYEVWHPHSDKPEEQPGSLQVKGLTKDLSACFLEVLFSHCLVNLVEKEAKSMLPVNSMYCVM